MKHLPNFILWTIIAIFFFTQVSCNKIDEPKPIVLDLTQPWVEATPGDVGMNASMIEEAAIKGEQNPRFGSLLVVRDGKLIFEEYFNGNHIDSTNDVRSVTKSVLFTLTALAVDNGFISEIDDPISIYIPEEFRSEDPAKEAITVRHLLTMSSGLDWPEIGGSIYNEWIQSEDQVNFVLDRPMVATAGSVFNYNSGAVHLLGVVLEGATNMKLEDLANQFLFSKIGISNWQWENSNGGYVNGGAGLDLRPRDLARFGQLYLQHGKSGEEQIFASEWIRQVEEPEHTMTWTYGVMTTIGYSYLWWTDMSRSTHAYLAWGYGGQYVYVVPDLDLVVVTTTNWRLLSLEGGSATIEKFCLDLIINNVVASVD